MLHAPLIALLACFLCSALAAPSLRAVEETIVPLVDDSGSLREDSEARNNSIVIWHGLGDSFDGDGIKSLAAHLAKKRNTFVHIVSIQDDAGADRKATFFGSAADEVEQAYTQISQIPQLKGGYDAIGFSQGGQLLRSLAQLHPEPPIRKLITMGSQHMGVARLPPCSDGDLLCKATEWALKAGVWTSYAQSHVLPAQYFRNQEDMGTYLRNSGWLRLVNNERWGDEQVGGSEDYREKDDGEGADHSPRDETLKDNFKKLERFVMFRFSEENTVSPPESAYFTVPDLRKDPPTAIPHAKLPLYRDDYIGLRALDERGDVHYGVCQGPHMTIDNACVRDVLLHLEGYPRKSTRKQDVSLVFQGQVL